MAKPKKVISLTRVRLASRRGHIVIVEPNTPTEIPEALFIEAAKAGCMDYNPQMIEALKKALEQAEKQELPAAAVAEQIDSMSIAKDAVRHVLLASDESPELLTTQGVPRLPAVRAAFQRLCDEKKVNSDLKITTDMVGLLLIEIQDETREQTAEAVDNRYPAALEANLDEEVGGLDMSQVADEE